MVILLLVFFMASSSSTTNTGLNRLPSLPVTSTTVTTPLSSQRLQTSVSTTPTRPLNPNIPPFQSNFVHQQVLHHFFPRLSLVFNIHLKLHPLYHLFLPITLPIPFFRQLNHHLSLPSLHH